jgi:ketosteroid isomerase-like protein
MIMTKKMHHTLSVAGAALMLSLSATSAIAGSGQPTVAREFYDAFQSGQLDRLDAITAEDVVTNSSAKFGNVGRAALKGWAKTFLTALAPRIDLVDEIEAVDSQGNGRAVATINLNWKHVAPFYNLQPTGRTGTSVENLIFTIRNGKIQRIEVADTTVDLVIYLHTQGWVFPQNIRPEPIIKGIERPVIEPKVSFK